MIKLYQDILDDKRQVVFKKLKPLTDYGGVLAGGTAIALQLNHRRSEDFDIFFPGLITDELKQTLFSIIDKPVEKRLDNPRQLTVTDGGGIKTSLVIHEFTPLYQTIKTDSLPLFSLADLASNKAFTLGKRGAWRDYVDLFFMIKSKFVSLPQIIKETKARFREQFSEKLFLEQLVYNKDIVDFNVDYVSEKYNQGEIMAFFENVVKDFLRENILE